jgi:hypothetical protein
MAASSILLYLLKANAALLLFTVAYFGLLRRLTFFTLNRAYLVFALLFAAVYPALPVPALLPAEATPAVLLTVVEDTGAAVALPAATAPAVDWLAVGVALYGAGVAILLGRLLMQLVSLVRLRQSSRPAVVNGLPVRVLPGDISPFSFGSTIYLNPDRHPGPELAAVLRHELVHVRQWHTVDVLLAQLALAAAWCNPAAWLLRRALLDNLEFLADRAVLETGLDRRAYQYSLLRLSHTANGLSLVSHFTFPTLKNRVAMMNAPASAAAQGGRYLLALTLTLGPALGFAAARAQRTAAAESGTQPGSGTHTYTYSAYYIDGKPSTKAAFEGLNPESIAYLNFLDDDKARQLFGSTSGKVAIVVTSANQHSAAVLALNKRVGRVAPWVPATPAQKAATAAAGAYIRNTYPNATLHFIGNSPKSDVAKPPYRAEFEDGGQTRQQYFDAQGQPVGAPATTGKPVGRAKPAAPAQSVPYLAAPALAYITKNYPNARLLAMTEMPAAAAGSPATYKAELAVGRRPINLLFDEQGGFISEVSSAR